MLFFPSFDEIKDLFCYGFFEKIQEPFFYGFRVILIVSRCSQMDMNGFRPAAASSS